MTIAPAPIETPIDLFDIELEQLLDGDVECQLPKCTQPATNDLVHPVKCTVHLCTGHTNAVIKTLSHATKARALMYCPFCRLAHIPPTTFTIRPI